jgi:hypothetical protein
MECSFFFEVIAPKGLKGLEKPIKEADLDLFIYHSGFNGKKILKSNSDGIIELGMDTSVTDLMHGSGYIESDFDTAKNIAKKLSDIFREAGYRHRIGVDDENGENTIWLEHQFSYPIETPKEYSTLTSGRRLQFRLKSLFVLTSFLAACIGAWRICVEFPVMQTPIYAILVILAPTLIGIGSTRIVCVCALVAGVVGAVVFACVNYFNPFLPADTFFYLVAYPTLVAAAGALTGLLASVLLTLKDSVRHR